MSRNFVELEQELIADLAQRTGRDLAQWMAAIEAAGLTEKNAIIDWLRPQGFTFANASWIERIHNNGGRPIYGRVPAATRGPRLAKVRETAAVVLPAVQPAPLPVAAPIAGDADQVKALIARGKAFRPLADLLVGEIARALPEVVIEAQHELVSFARPRELAVLLIGPRELRLGLDLGERPFDTTLAKAKILGAGSRMTHMLVLTDARQVGPPLLDLVRRADERANPVPPSVTPAGS